DELEAIARDFRHAGLSRAEVAMMAFAQKVTSQAHAITAADVEVLRQHGFSDAEIFDIVLTAAARCFFSNVVDAVGATPDEAFRNLDERLLRVLTVGRPFDDAAAKLGQRTSWLGRSSPSSSAAPTTTSCSARRPARSRRAARCHSARRSPGVSRSSSRWSPPT